VGVTTQDPALELRSIRRWAPRRLKNYLKTVNMELTTIARACGKQDVHHLEKEDLVALTVEAAAMAGVPLAGTSWIPGQTGPRD
jgi:glutamate synthase domain-containing protein 2